MAALYRHSPPASFVLWGVFLCLAVFTNGNALTSPGSSPMHCRVVGDQVYFSADDGVHGRELWQCDANGICSLAADILPGPKGSALMHLLPVQDKLYFSTSTVSSGADLCFYDTKEHVVVPITRSMDVLADKTIVAVHATDKRIFFLVTKNKNNVGLWTTVCGSTTCEPVNTSGLLYRTQEQFVLQRTGNLMSCMSSNQIDFFDEDVLLSQSAIFPETLTPYQPLDSIVPGVLLVALGDHAECGVEPICLDVPSGRVTLLKDIFPGPVSSNVDQSCLHRGLLYFTADDNVHGREVWRTDGTPEGTWMVADVASGKASSYAYKLCSVGAYLYFVANDGLRGAELWRTDGTGEGTLLVCDLSPGGTSPPLWSLASFQDKLYFCTETSQTGEEVFYTGGSPETTGVLRDIVPGPGGSGPHNITPFGDMIFFTCDDGAHGEEPWISDGTENGTRLATDIAFPTRQPSSGPDGLVSYSGLLLFNADDAAHGREPWISDGSETGTQLLLDIYPGKTGSLPGPFVQQGGLFFFAATTPEYGRELWCSKGDVETTRLVLDIAPGQADASPNMLTTLEDALYFVAEDRDYEPGLWRISGSDTSPEKLLDFRPYNAEMPPTGLFALWNTLYARFRNSSQEIYIYRVESTAQGRAGMKRIRTGFDTIHSLVKNWPSEASTVLFRDALAQTLYTASPRLPMAARDSTGESTLFFPAHTEVHGSELWKSDGTPAGTCLVGDLFPGPASSSPDQLTVLDDRLYFIAEDPGDGRILFVYDSATASAIPLVVSQHDFDWPPFGAQTCAIFNSGLLCTSILPSRAVMSGPYLLYIYELRGKTYCRPLLTLPADPGRWPDAITSSGERAYFVYNDEKHGVELWVTDGTAEGTRMVKDINVGL